METSKTISPETIRTRCKRMAKAGIVRETFDSLKDEFALTEDMYDAFSALFAGKISPFHVSSSNTGNEEDGRPKGIDCIDEFIANCLSNK